MNGNELRQERDAKPKRWDGNAVSQHAWCRDGDLLLVGEPQKEREEKRRALEEAARKAKQDEEQAKAAADAIARVFVARARWCVYSRPR